MVDPAAAVVVLVLQQSQPTQRLRLSLGRTHHLQHDRRSAFVGASVHVLAGSVQGLIFACVTTRKIAVEKQRRQQVIGKEVRLGGACRSKEEVDLFDDELSRLLRQGLNLLFRHARRLRDTIPHQPPTEQRHTMIHVEHCNVQWKCAMKSPVLRRRDDVGHLGRGNDLVGGLKP